MSVKVMEGIWNLCMGRSICVKDSKMFQIYLPSVKVMEDLCQRLKDASNLFTISEGYGGFVSKTQRCFKFIYHQ